MKCPNCNSPVEKGDLFCPVCGSKLDVKKQSKMSAIASGIIVLLVGLVLVIWLFWGAESSQDKEDGNEAKITAYTKSAVDEETTKEDKDNKVNMAEIPSEDSEKEVEENKIEENEMDVDYILSESNTRYLTDADIQGLSIQELNYAKNEIYARHGRKFDSPELQNYFNSKSWYSGKYSPADFDANYSASVLSDIEKKNAEFLKNAEYSISSSGYKLDQ